METKKLQAEQLLQDLLYFSGLIQGKLEGEITEDDLTATVEAVSSALKELDVIPYL